MSEQGSLQDLTDSAAPSRRGGLLRQKLPYLIVLVLAILGVAYTSVSHKPLYGYWEFLAIAIGVACVVMGWRKAGDTKARIRVAVTQALHWGAFLAAMNILLLPSVNTFLNAPATGLALMLLLALGTFVAGVHASAQIAILGLAMALTVPAIAWLKQSALFLILGGLAIAGFGMAFWPQGSGEGSSKDLD